MMGTGDGYTPNKCQAAYEKILGFARRNLEEGETITLHPDVFMVELGIGMASARAAVTTVVLKLKSEGLYDVEYARGKGFIISPHQEPEPQDEEGAQDAKQAEAQILRSAPVEAPKPAVKELSKCPYCTWSGREAALQGHLNYHKKALTVAPEPGS